MTSHCECKCWSRSRLPTSMRGSCSTPSNSVEQAVTAADAARTGSTCLVRRWECGRCCDSSTATASMSKACNAPSSWMIREAPRARRCFVPACKTPCCWPAPVSSTTAHYEMGCDAPAFTSTVAKRANLVFIDFHTVLFDIWRGDFTEARATRRGLDGAAHSSWAAYLPVCVGLTVRALLAAYLGNESTKRAATPPRPWPPAMKSGSRSLFQWPVTVSGLSRRNAGQLFDGTENAAAGGCLASIAAPDGTELIVRLICARRRGSHRSSWVVWRMPSL